MPPAVSGSCSSLTSLRDHNRKVTTVTTESHEAAEEYPDWVSAIVRCPVTGTELVTGHGPDGEPELHNTDAGRPLAYPVRDGIPVLLEVEARQR